MKKLIFSLVVMFAALASVNAQSRGLMSPVPTQNVNSEFFEIYNQAVELNKDAYPDFHKIPINAPVAFPDYDNDGVVYFPARVPENGKHDCIWYLSLDYQQLKANYQDSVQRARAEVKPAPVIIPSVPEKNTDWDFWVWIILIGIAIVAIAGYLLNRFRPWNNRQNLDNHPSINGGLSHNPGEAAAQISALTGSRVVRSERGRLICDRPVRVEMNFSDGVKRVMLVSGEVYYRITESNGTVRYARQSCGNLIGGSISVLPEGVTFVPSTEENSSWTPDSVTTDNANTPAAEVKPEENKISDFEGLSKVLEIAGAMVNAPAKITFGDLVVEFQPAPVKEDNKDK